MVRKRLRVYSNDLPDETENQVNLSFSQIRGTNVDYRATNSLGGIDNQVLIFCDFEGIQLWTFVNGSFINGSFHCIVDKFANKITRA